MKADVIIDRRDPQTRMFARNAGMCMHAGGQWGRADIICVLKLVSSNELPNRLSFIDKD